MTESDASNALWWFDQLSLDDRVALLHDPYRSLPVRLIDTFSRRPGWLASRAFWWSNNTNGDSYSLIGPTAQQLADYRDQLNFWWNELDTADIDYLIDHRNNELEAGYAEKVQDVTKLPLQPDNPLCYVVARDSDTGKFRLHGLAAVYVELQLRLRDGDQPALTV